MKIATWNVNSIRARIENVKEYLNKFSPDIMMMQEIKTPDETYPYDDIKNLKYENYVFGQKSYNGVAIISKYKLENIRTDFIKDDLKQSRIITGELKINLKKYLDKISQGCATNKQNLLSLAIQAAENKATLGEISYACEKIFGRYQANTKLA